MSDWYDKVVNLTSSYPIAERFQPIADGLKRKPGDVVFRRMTGRETRNRYYMLRADANGHLNLTNAVIQYQKSRNAWAIFILPRDAGVYLMTSVNGSNEDPVKRYKTLTSAKMALMSNPLDRVGAEIDAICEATNGSEKSLSAGNSAPQT